MRQQAQPWDRRPGRDPRRLRRVAVHIWNISAGWRKNREWLAGANLSLADFVAAAHLSCLDYIGDVDWRLSRPAKDWYARIKSRPGFRARLLSDRVPGITPPAHYVDLDF